MEPRRSIARAFGCCLLVAVAGCTSLTDRDAPDSTADVANPFGGADAGAGAGPGDGGSGPADAMLPGDLSERADAAPGVDACSPTCAGRVCGDDGCGGSCGACGVGTTCADGQCVEEAPAGPPCAAGWACVDGCGADRDCALGCAAEVDPAHRARLRAAVRCRAEHCAVCAGDPVCEAHCVHDACADAVYGCFRGEATCAEVGACVDACADDPACGAACARAGTPAAQRLWWDLVLCVTDACGADGARDCRALQTGPGGACADALDACR